LRQPHHRRAGRVVTTTNPVDQRREHVGEKTFRKLVAIDGRPRRLGLVSYRRCQLRSHSLQCDAAHIAAYECPLVFIGSCLVLLTDVAVFVTETPGEVGQTSGDKS
jgi:hypothetical protein